MRTSEPAKWFRLYAEFATDPKVQMLSEQDQRRFIMLLCLRCGNGDVITLHDAEIAFQLRITEQEWASTKAILVGKHLITESGKPVAWDKRQYASDTSTARVAKHRELKKRLCNVAVTAPETETEAEAEAEAEAEYKNLSPTALPASPEKTPGEASPLACPVEKIVSLYHKHLPNNPRVKMTTDKRHRMIRQRWREASKLSTAPFGYDTQSDGLKAWSEFFSVCAESDFLTGKVPPLAGRAPFVADLDFLLSPNGFVKTLENKYHREVA